MDGGGGGEGFKLSEWHLISLIPTHIGHCEWIYDSRDKRNLNY